MATIHLVFGPQGAGKSTYSRQLTARVGGVVFSIDDWMTQLYGPDLPQPMDVRWIVERIRRCEQRIWATAKDIGGSGGNVVLDLGFMKIESRAAFLSLAEASGLPARLHFVTAPLAVRRTRVLARNADKGETFSFEVTAPMFDFMERGFEPPTADELASSILIDSN